MRNVKKEENKICTALVCEHMVCLCSCTCAKIENTLNVKVAAVKDISCLW